MEMNIRKILKYPPYYFLISLKVISSDYKLALEHATKVGEYLKDNLDSSSIILGPTTANLFKFNNNYRFQLVIKYRFDCNISNTLKYLDDIYINNPNVKLEIDIDPIHI